MVEQKFFIGDRVIIRPFDEIDTEDNGSIPMTSEVCYGISRGFIEDIRLHNGADEVYEIISAEKRRDGSTYVYHLRRVRDNHSDGLFWGQGMLAGEHELEDIPEPDQDGLFSVLIFG